MQCLKATALILGALAACNEKPAAPRSAPTKTDVIEAQNETIRKVAEKKPIWDHLRKLDFGKMSDDELVAELKEHAFAPVTSELDAEEVMATVKMIGLVGKRKIMWARPLLDEIRAYHRDAQSKAEFFDAQTHKEVAGWCEAELLRFEYLDNGLADYDDMFHDLFETEVSHLRQAKVVPLAVQGLASELAVDKGEYLMDIVREQNAERVKKQHALRFLTLAVNADYSEEMIGLLKKSIVAGHKTETGMMLGYLGTKGGKRIIDELIGMVDQMPNEETMEKVLSIVSEIRVRIGVLDASQKELLRIVGKNKGSGVAEKIKSLVKD